VNKVEINHQIPIFNPYETFSDESQEEAIENAVKKSTSAPNEKVIELADKVVEWGQDRLFTDYEKAIDSLGAGAKALDWGVFSVVASMQGVVVIDSIFRLKALSLHPLSKIPVILPLLTFPLAIFFFFMGCIEGVVEFINLKRVSNFLHSMEKKDPEIQLEWLKKRYFSLDSKEASKIYHFIERLFPNLPLEEKAKNFGRIAQKALKIKFESLKRRITPDLAEEVFKEISKEPKSPEDIHRVQCLMESVKRQAKNKTVVHILGLAAISLSLISITGLVIGVTHGFFFVALATGAIGLLALQFIMKKGTLAKEVERFYNRLLSKLSGYEDLTQRRTSHEDAKIFINR